MQDDFDSSHTALARHVRVSRDHDASGVQPIGCSQHVLDKRHAAELGYKLVRSEAGARARCHDDASVLCLRSASGVGHDGGASANSMVGQVCFRGCPLRHSIIAKNM